MNTTPSFRRAAFWTSLATFTTCVHVHGQATCVPVPDGAVAWYRAEDDGLDFLNAHPGTLKNGTAFAPGMVGRAFSFDGVDDVVEIPDSPDLNPAQITLEAWVKPDSITTGSRVVSKELSAGSCQPPYGVWSIDIRAESGGRAVFHVNIGGTLHNLFGTTMIPTGQFTHIAATYDGSTARIYVNGVAENSLALGGDLASSTAPVLIGDAGVETRVCYPGLVEFKGLIDEVTIYSRALSGNEIAGLFSAGEAGKCPVPRLHIVPAGADLIVSWSPADPAFTLEQTTDLPAASWEPGPAGNPTAPFPASSKTRFYRLRRL